VSADDAGDFRPCDECGHDGQDHSVVATLCLMAGCPCGMP
jgi:hypothetical protein